MPEQPLSGTLTALVTPFYSAAENPFAIDYTSLEKLIEWQLAEGVDGFVVCGTTAENATLSPEERLSLLNFTKKVVGSKAPIVMGTGSNSTQGSIEFTKAVAEIGVDAALVVSPYYNKPTQEGLYQHFRACAEQGGLPVVLYNIPSRTGVDIAIETFERLAKLPGIVGVKEASGSPLKLTQLAGLVDNNFSLLSGEDALTYLTLACGGKGVISASANAIPAEMAAISSRYLAGDLEGAKQAQLKALPYIEALFLETNPAPAKAVLQSLGKIQSEILRAPLVPVQDKTRARLEELFLK